MSDKIFGIKENKSLVEITPMANSMNLNGSQTITGEKTFEKIVVKDFNISNTESGASVTFKAQDGMSFELTLPGHAGTVALVEDIPLQNKYYQHNVVVEVKSSSQTINRDFSFQILNKSADEFTFNSLIEYFKGMSVNGEFVGLYNSYRLSDNDPVLDKIGNRFKNVWESGTWKGLDCWTSGLYNSEISAHTVSSWSRAWDDSTRGTSSMWSIHDEVVEV
ncbi:MAG: hypothetical protein MJ000_11630 [Bacteroidales bacterium]|nr:hypothetical protein [Bacteroidales bacterium]